MTRSHPLHFQVLKRNWLFKGNNNSNVAVSNVTKTNRQIYYQTNTFLSFCRSISFYFATLSVKISFLYLCVSVCSQMCSSYIVIVLFFYLCFFLQITFVTKTHTHSILGAWNPRFECIAGKQVLLISFHRPKHFFTPSSSLQKKNEMRAGSFQNCCCP